MLLGSDFSWESRGLKYPQTHTNHRLGLKEFSVFLMSVWKKSLAVKGCTESPRLCSVTLKFTWFTEFLWGFDVWGQRNFVGITALFVWLVLYCGTGCFQVTWGETNYFLQHLLSGALFWLDTWFRHFFFFFSRKPFAEYLWLSFCW